MRMALVWWGCFVLLFFVYVLLLAPQKKVRKELEKQLAKKKQVYDSALEAAQKETKFRFKEEIERLRGELGKLVVDFEDATNLTFEVSRIANEKGVDSFSIETQSSGRNKESGSGYIFKNSFDVSFHATGFNQFAALLNALERHKPVIFVDEFVIRRSGIGDLEHRANMKLAVFVRNKWVTPVASL